MNIKSIYATVAIMAFALSGLIVLQYKWITEALEIKEAQFSQHVVYALQQVSKQVENLEASRMFWRSLDIQNNRQLTTFTLGDSLYVTHPVEQALHFSCDSMGIDLTVVGGGGNADRSHLRLTAVSTDENIIFGVYCEAISSNEGVLAKKVLPDSPAWRAGIRDGDIITAINRTSINGPSDVERALKSCKAGNSIDITYYRNNVQMPDFLSVSGDQNLREQMLKQYADHLDQNLQNNNKPVRIGNVALMEPDTAQIEQRHLYFERFMQQINLGSQTIEERISPDDLDRIVQQTFKDQGIQLSYDYCLKLSGSSDIIFGTACSPTPDFFEKAYRKLLYSNGSAASYGELFVHFPKRNHYLWSSSLGTLFLSLLFNLAIIGTFTYTTYTIIRQKKLSDMKTDFINNMTHELKTPISTIQLAAEMLTDKGLTKTENFINRYAGMIREENQRLQSHVEKVLQFARMEKGNFKLAIETLDLHDLIEEVIIKTSLRVEKEGGAIHHEFNAQQPEIEADRLHLTNIIYNLVDNAIKYSKENPTVHIYTQDDEHDIRISIKDNGIGMSKEALKRVFEKFYRVPTGNVHNVKGFGLGLSYVKLMVEAHGGSIKASSKQGKGSIFEITLPKKHLV